MAHDLIRLSQRGRDLVLVELPARGRELIRRIPEPVQIKLRRVTKQSLKITLAVVAGLLIVGVLATAIIYERLRHGPISLTFLVPSIESAINRELTGVAVEIDDALVQKSDEGAGVFFRLRNIRLVDAQGGVIARAPLAAVGLSARALLWGRIAPGSVDFIGPRLLLYYTSEEGLSLTFSRQQAAAPHTTAELTETASGPSQSEVVAAEPSEPATGARGLGLVDTEQQISLSRTLAAVFERARGGETASSYLTRFGVRNATVVFDSGGERSYWQVPDFSIDMRHRGDRSILVGDANIASTNGPWQFQFRTEQSDEQQRMTLTALVKDLVPMGLVANFPSLQALQALNLPVTAETTLDLDSEGELIGAEARMSFSNGQVVVPWDRKHPILLDSGDLRVRYETQGERIEIPRSTVRWGGSTLSLSGSFEPIAPEDGMERWQFNLEANDSVLFADEFGLPSMPVDEWTAEGTVTPDAGKIILSRFYVRAGDADIELAGSVIDAPGSPQVRLRGRFGAMPIKVLKQFWPKFVGAGAREWIGKRVTAGQLMGGTLSVDLPAGLLAEIRNGGDIPDDAVMIDLEGTGLEIHYIMGMPPIQTGDAKLWIRGRKFAMEVPQGHIVLPSGHRIALGEGRISTDDLRVDPQAGEITFKTAASAPAALELLDHEPLGYPTVLGIKPSDIGGRVEGSFRVNLPMTRKLTFDDVVLRGVAQLDSVQTGSTFGRAEIQGGTLDFRVTEQALQATGDIMLNGVPASLNWQRIFRAPPEMQPEIRVGITLDESSRKTLGLNINDMVRGVVPTTLSIKQYKSDGPMVRVRADLTNTDLVLSNIGWRKRPGRTASLGFDVVTTEAGTELQNFKISGEDISIDGWIALDAKDAPHSFYFNDFSFNVITHLELSGRLREDQVWDVKANGSVYDGRQFFQSLFSAGQLADDVPGAPSKGGNIDLTARIGAMVGFFDTTAKDVSITLKKRNGYLEHLDASAMLNGTAPVAARLVSTPGQPRLLVAETRDAGSAFRLIGFYPKVEGGEASLQVNLEGSGGASKTGTLWARDFVILGDRVVGEVLSNTSDDPMNMFRQPNAPRTIERQRIVFNQLRVPFAVGGGRFVLQDSYINGPLLGATLRGQVDFGQQTVDLGGTYVPLYGLNSALGSIPLIGPLLVGRRGEGVLGITFAIQGPITDPNVLVNPMSMVAPGIFRQIFEFQGGHPGQAAAQPVAPERQQPVRRRQSVN